MQLKPITAIIVLSLAVASLLTGGCISSTTTTNTESSQNASNLSDELNERYSNEGDKIVTPFSKHTNQYGNTIYTGIVDDDVSSHIKAYRRDITIEQIATKNTTISRTKEWNQLLHNQGFGLGIGLNATAWSGINHYDENRAVSFSVRDPHGPNTIWGYGENYGYFSITVDYKTLLT